jgi:hypothetical protein
MQGARATPARFAYDGHPMRFHGTLMVSVAQRSSRASGSRRTPREVKERQLSCTDDQHSANLGQESGENGEVFFHVGGPAGRGAGRARGKSESGLARGFGSRCLRVRGRVRMQEARRVQMSAGSRLARSARSGPDVCGSRGSRAGTWLGRSGPNVCGSPGRLPRAERSRCLRLQVGRVPERSRCLRVGR